MTKNDVKIAKNDEKRANLDEKTDILGIFRSFLVSQLEEAKAAVDYYDSSKNGGMKHKLLTEKWRRKKEKIQRQLSLERISPEEFSQAAGLYHERVKSSLR